MHGVDKDVVPISTTEVLGARAEELYTLGQSDPAEAIRRIRTLTAVPTLLRQLQHVQASLLIDIGSRARSNTAVEEGVELFRALRNANLENPDYQYNLANGLMALATLDHTSRPGWFLATRKIRLEARRLLAIAGRCDTHALATRALTNLGNALGQSHRWSEAFDLYVEALRLDRTNVVAAGSAAQLLLWLSSLGIGDSAALRGVAIRYSEIARANIDRAVELGGPAAAEAFAKLPIDEGGPRLDLSGLGDYLRFVARHRLALVPTIEGLDPIDRHWDSACVSYLQEPVESGHEPPPIFAMINTIKAGYLAARRLAFQALEMKEEQTGLYADTLDYAMYGTDVASVLLAQRAAIDVLDQIAVALNEYLKIGMDVRQVDFVRLWREDKKKETWRPAIEEEIAKGNAAVVALGELAMDLSEGFLRRKLETRNTSTHRFTVLHDEGIGSSRACEAIEHVYHRTFVRETIETLQFVRSAILYLVEVITVRERRDRGVAVPMLILPHHFVRRDE